MSDGNGGEGVPQEVDTEGDLRGRTLGDDAGHGGDLLDASFEDVGAIILVAEHDRIDAARHKSLDIRLHPLDEQGYASGLIVAGSARQRRDVRHGNYWFGLLEECRQPIGHDRFLP